MIQLQPRNPAAQRTPCAPVPRAAIISPMGDLVLQTEREYTAALATPAPARVAAALRTLPETADPATLYAAVLIHLRDLFAPLVAAILVAEPTGGLWVAAAANLPTLPPRLSADCGPAIDGVIATTALDPALAGPLLAAGVQGVWRIALPGVDAGGVALLGYGAVAPDPGAAFPLLQLYLHSVGAVLIAADLRARLTAQRLQLEAAEAVSEITAALNSHLGEPDVLQLIADRAQDLLAADGAAINLLEADGRSVRTTVVSGAAMQPLLGRVYSAETSIVARVTLTGEPEIWTTSQPSGSDELGITASLVHPLTGPFGPIGSIGVLAQPGGRHFGPSDVRLLELFARQAALAITNARMLERSRLEATFQATFNGIIEALLLAHSDDEVQASLVETAARLIPCESCFFSAYSSDLTVAAIRHAWTAPTGCDLRGSSDPQTAWPDLLPAILRGDLLYWTESGNPDPAPSELTCRAAGIESFILVPVLYRGWLLGVLGFANIAQMPNWLPLTPDLLRHLAAQVASALTTARLYEETREHLAAVRRLSERLHALNNVSVQIQAARHADEVYAQTFAGLRSLGLHAVALGLDAPAGWVQVLAHSFNERDLAKVAAKGGLPSGGLPLDSVPAIKDALHRREVQFTPDISPVLTAIFPTADPTLRQVFSEILGVWHAIVAPLIARDRLLGLLVIMGANLQPGDETALAPLASQAAVALDKAYLYDAMQAAHRFSGSLIDSMSEGLAVVDTEGRHVLANRAFCAMVGYTPEELDGRLPPYPYGPADEDERSWATFATLIGGELPPGREVPVTLRRHDGSAFSAGLTPAEVHDERGRVTGLMVIVRDLTERERLEATAAQAHAAREADRLKSELLATVSHELRTPLAAIKGFTSTMLRYGDRLSLEEQREFLGDIEQSSDRLAELVGNLLNMGRLEAALLSMEPERIDLAPLLRAEAADFMPRLVARRQTLTVEIPEHLPPVPADPRRIRQVLANLLDNAAKYTPLGGHIRVSAADEGDWVCFAVADSGPGIPADHLQRVFEPFHRVDSGLTRTVGGTGLGLAITRRILDAHHGRIQVESPPGQGALFTVRLPVAPAGAGGELC